MKRLYGRPYLCALCLLIVTIFLSGYVRPARIDNNLEDNVLQDRNLREYTDFRNRFGNDRILIGALPFEKFDGPLLLSLCELEERLMATGDLKKILSPVGLLRDFFGVSGRKELEAWLKTRGNVDGFVEKLKSLSVARGQVVSFEKKTVGLVLVLSDDYKYTDVSVIDRLKKIIRESPSLGKRLVATGVPDIVGVIYKYTAFCQKVFAPATILLMALMLLFLYRSAFGLLAPLVSVIVPLLWLQAFFNIAGKTANFITTMVPPLLLAVAMTSCIHLLTAYIFASRDKEEFQLDTLVEVVREQSPPILLCQLTTLLGFLTLAANGVGAIREYGLFAGLGIVLILISVFILLPVMITILKVTRQKRTIVMTADGFFSALSDFVFSHRWAIVFGSLATAALCCMGISRLSVETGLLRHIPPDHPVIRNVRLIEQGLGGIVPVHICLERKGKGIQNSLVDPLVCKAIAGLQEKLVAIENVDSALSFVNFVRDYDSLFSGEDDNIPPSAEEVEEYLDFFRTDDGASPVDRFITRDYSKAHIALRIRDISSREFCEVFRRIRLALAGSSLYRLGVGCHLTGRAYLWVLTSRIIAWNEITNFLLALLIISLVIVFYFRSLSVGLMSLLPNVLPLAVIYGLMGFLSIPVNTLTGMIACVAIGMTVDDTIHFIYAFRRETDRGLQPEEAARRAMLKKGSSMVFTTLVIMAGFSVLMLSKFPPNFQFGAAVSFTFATALILDLTLTPALLLILRPFSPAPSYVIPFSGRVARALIPLVTMTPQAMAAYAKENSAFYRRFYKNLDTDDFDSLPLLAKKMVRQCSPFDFLSDWYKDKVFYYGETTGSSGSPTPSFMMKREYNGVVYMSRMTPYYSALAAALARNRVCVNGMSFGFTIAGEAFAHMMVHNGALVANVGSRSTLATPERTADAVSRLFPGFIVGAPIDLLAWLRIVREDHPGVYDRVVDNLSIFLSSAELCSQSRRRAIEKHFGILQIDNYATVEGFFSIACPCGAKHLLPMYVVELFDEHLEKIGHEGRGRLVFTNLAKRSTPLVRYLLDDLVTVRSSPGCPFGFDREIIPHGRFELSVRVNDRLLNVGDFEQVIFREGLFGDYRVRLFDRNRAEVILEDYAAPKNAAKAVAERFRDCFGLDCKVRLEAYGSLTPFREPRTAKAILKVEDRRSCSEQEIPKVL